MPGSVRAIDHPHDRAKVAVVTTDRPLTSPLLLHRPTSPRPPPPRPPNQRAAPPLPAARPPNPSGLQPSRPCPALPRPVPTPPRLSPPPDLAPPPPPAPALAEAMVAAFLAAERKLVSDVGPKIAMRAPPVPVATY
eukprot:tig00000455_g986.t1